MEGKDGQYNMIVDGADLAGVLATPGIDWKKTYSNHTPKVSFTMKTVFKNLKEYLFDFHLKNLPFKFRFQLFISSSILLTFSIKK